MQLTRHSDINFYQSDNITKLGVRTVSWIEHGLDNTSDPQHINSLRNQYYTQANNNKTTIDQCISGYYTLREAVGRSVRRFPPSPLALRDQFLRKNEISSVSTAVDIYNLVSLTTGLSIGAHDLSTLSGDIRLDITQGNECFHPLGSKEERILPAGEYAYLDDKNQVLCRMEFRQSAHTCLTRKHLDALFIVQGHQDTSDEMLHSAAQQVSELMKKYCKSQQGKVWQTP
ncbi:MAG: phenylalanine--tRNA ligase beta subunit-related protein [Gammaproteobacteria bacterium]|nr:phenylalanine--tRNA ligase beta subunit-related protein [Gammaproteobacteria bacterium]